MDSELHRNGGHPGNPNLVDLASRGNLGTTVSFYFQPTALLTNSSGCPGSEFVPVVHEVKGRKSCKLCMPGCFQEGGRR